MAEQYSDILDNQNFAVKDRANALAKGAESVKIAVGYFFIGGFDLLAENLREADSIQLLIGRETNAETIEELKRVFEEDLDLFDPDEASEGVQNLYELSQLDQVEIKIFGKDGPRFHPKLYLYQYPEDHEFIKSPGAAIVGSSNLSASGLTGNIELNVEKRDANSIRYLDGWFDELWDEADEFSTALLREIFRDSQFKDAVDEVDFQRGGKTGLLEPISEAEVISPFEATQRYIVEQFPREIDDGTLLEEIRGEWGDKLPEFQRDAVSAARYALDKYDGVILADSVGLGKSYIGAPLVQEGTTEQDRVLIIGPNRLEDMWMGEIFGKHANQEGEFELRADATFLSFASLSRLSEGEIQELRTYDYVLIDEAHQLRNQRTKRYAKLQAIGRRGKKFVCLTATPVQNSVRDVDNLIKIFADDDDFDIELVGPPSDIFREYDRLTSISEEDLSDADKSRIGNLRSQITKVMREVMISRDREFILENYGDNIQIGGRTIRVPERKPRKVTPNDPSLEDLYHDIVTAVVGALDEEDDTGLNLPYLVAQRYDRDFDEEEELTLDYQSTAVLMAINLLKRLESSIAAFEASVNSLMERERATLRIAQGDFEDAQSRIEAIEYLEGTLDSFEGEVDIDEIVSAVDAMDGEERDQLIADIESDLQQLERLRERARQVLSDDGGGGITGSHGDAKAATLMDKLEMELEGEKVLLFSQFIPTIEHLFKELTGEDPSRRQIAQLKGLDERTVAFVHGDAYDDRIIDRFAPEGRKPAEAVSRDDEIDILLATDVIGVGQNLPDARVLVNYDLHWNPMKMEQRIGRIDRITTRHDELLIYNFVPIGDLRKHLGLLERLELKISRIADSVGYSAPIIDSAEERVQKAFTIYDNLDEADFSDSEFEGIGSKYDELRRRVQTFCAEHSASVEDLRETKVQLVDAVTPQYFVIADNETKAYMALTRIWYNTGRSEWRHTLFNKSGLSTVTLGGQTKFQSHPRMGVDEIEIFELIASGDNERRDLPNEREGDIRTFAEDINSAQTWAAEILARDQEQNPEIDRIEHFCRRIVEDQSYESEINQMATEIIDQLSAPELEGVDRMAMSDYAEKELDQIFRRRRRYGYKGVVRRLHRKLTEEIELVPPETPMEAEVVLFGDIDQ